MRSASGSAVAGLLALSTAVAVTACTSQPDGVPSPVPTPSGSAAPATAAPPPTLAPLPGAATTGAPVVAVEATRGPVPVGTVELRSGALWVSLDCVADDHPGTLAVILEPGLRFDLECPTDEVHRTRNLDQDHVGGPASVRVEAEPGVHWNLLIEQ